MRVSSNMMSNNYLNQLNNQYSKQAELMKQSDGSRIHRPSDDPVAFVKTMTYKNSLAANEQYTKNLDDAVSWMQTTDNAMVNMTDILKSIVEKTTASANGTNTPNDLAAAGQAVDSLIQQMITIGNSQLGDRYVFSGQADKTQPFITGTVTDRVDVKTLDAKQADAFGTDQMLTLTDTTTNDTYYLNTKNGSLFTKDYVDNGYKKTLADHASDTTANIKAAVAGSAAGTLNKFTSTTFTPPTTQSQQFMIDNFNKNGTVIGTNSFTSTINSNNLKFSTSNKNVVTYAGDNVKISMPIQNGDATPSRDSVNSTGVDLFGTDIFGGAGTELINNLYEISAHMKSGDYKWLSSDGITLANNAHNQVLNAETEVAARKANYDLTKTAMENQNTQIQTDVTNNSAADIAELIVNLQTTQTLYNMSLQVGSKILPKSLADYLS